MNTDQHVFNEYLTKAKPFFSQRAPRFVCPLGNNDSYEEFEGSKNYSDTRMHLYRIVDDFYCAEEFNDKFGKYPDLTSYPHVSVDEQLISREFDLSTHGAEINISPFELGYQVRVVGLSKEVFLELERVSSGVFTLRSGPSELKEVLANTTFCDGEHFESDAYDIMNNMWLKTWFVTNDAGSELLHSLSPDKARSFDYGDIKFESGMVA
tara:strand:+ start:785 stop:1411 length:627 start_codon:yes stop_codon:yes gene_type:complete